MVYNALPSTTGEAEEISIDGTAEVPFRKIDLKGNTSQKTTTGKNLFNASYYKDQTVYNETVAIETGNVSCVKLYLKPNTTYTISEALNNWTLTGAFLFAVINTNNQVIRYLQTRPQDYQTNPTTFTTNSEGYVYIGHRYGFSPSDRMITFLNTVNMQIEEGNTATSFEEYTGGASPNPDYPQEIEVVTGNNIIKVEGKNLFNKDTITGITNGSLSNDVIVSNAISSDYGGVSANINSLSLNAGTYYISMKVKRASGTNTYNINRITLVGIDSSQITMVEKPTLSGEYQVYMCSINSSASISLTNIGIQLQTNNNSVVLNIKDIMVSKSNNNIYQEYQGQTYSINLGNIELCKIGDYQDSIVKDNGIWYLHKQIGKVVLNGSENWGNFSIEPSGLGRAMVSSSNVYYNSGQNTIMASNMVGVEFGGSWNKTYDCIATSSSNKFIAYLKNASDLATFKSILNNSNAIVYYVLATPTTTEITDTTLISQLEALENAYSYDAQTNISQTNQDNPFIISYEAILSLKNVLNSLETRIAVLETE